MRASRDPRRLVEYDGLRSVLRDALAAERADDGADAARLRRIGERVAVQIGSAAPGALAQEGGARSWFGVKGAVTVVAALALVGFGTASFSESQTISSPSRVARTPSEVVVAHRSIDKGVRQMATVAAEDLPAAPPPVAAPASPPVRVAPPSSAAVTPEEIALLARAHDALRERPADSLALCREHEQRFAGGQFVQEREAVAIEALVYLGRRAEAETRWDAFKRRHPASSHNVHLVSLFAEH